MTTLDSGQNILCLQTVQISPFRTLMTALKDILLETNIAFTQVGIYLQFQTALRGSCNI